MISTDTHSEGLAVSVRGLRKSYGEIEAVRGISFAVPRGEVFCLLGPNGAGKTTTVDILEGYRTADGGDVRVLGMDPADGQRELRERVGIVLQQCGVQRDLTVTELIEMYGRYHRHRRPVNDVLELVELTEKRASRSASPRSRTSTLSSPARVRPITIQCERRLCDELRPDTVAEA